MAPEIVKLRKNEGNSRVNYETILTNPFKCDIYSVGISILQLIYPTANSKSLIKILKENIDNENIEYTSILRLCEKMLQENNEDRPTFEKMIQEIKN